jgi:pilus assembly protein CpaD
MTRFPYALRIAAALSAGGLAACASNGGPNPQLPESYLTGTALDRNAIEVVKRTEFLEVGIDAEASELSDADRRRIQSFVMAYLDSGQGPFVVSLPTSSVNPQLAIAASAEARDIARDTGVQYREIAGTTHGEGTGINEPLILAFQTYEALPPDCKTFAEIDVMDASTNNEMEQLGCAVRTNLAAMIADPADLLGERAFGRGDPVRRAIILGKFREGQPTGASRSNDESGSISDAVKE